jgi:squalene-hopene/tetraprenyl-beta-curcumene cyclase
MTSSPKPDEPTVAAAQPADGSTGSTRVPADDVAKAIERGAEALLRHQRSDGSFGWDAPASILGTAGTVAALHAADPKGAADLISRGAAWLREQQHADGGWGGVVGADSEAVGTSVALAALALAAPDDSAEAIAAGRAGLARLGGVDAVNDRAISLLCRQLLMAAGLTAEAGTLRRLPLEIVFFDKVRRERISFRTSPFIGLALMQADMLPTGPLRRATLRRARPTALRLLRSIYDHEGRTGAFSEDPWPAALVLIGLGRSGEAPDIASAIVGWLRRAVRPDGAWDAVTNLDLTRSGYAATGLIAAGYAGDARLRATREFFRATQKKEAFEVFGVPPGGWSFSNARGWPVTLESAEIISALAGFGDDQSDPVLRTGLDWLLGRQDSRGSWSLWVRNTKLMNDGPDPAITSQAITALRDAGYPADHRAIASAADWLLTQQRPDGTFENLWYRDYTSGTAVVVSALSRAGRSGHDAIRRSVAWLCRTQLPDGSWGPGDGSAGTAGSVEETSWAVEALLASGAGSAGSAAEPSAQAAVDRGVAWLVAAARPDGEWEPTRLCNYIRFNMLYSNGVITQGVALRALGEYRDATNGHAENGHAPTGQAAGGNAADGPADTGAR